MPDFFNSAGQRRTEVTFLAPTQARNARYNTREIGWEEVAINVPAWVQDALPSRSERGFEGVTVAAWPCRLRLRWRDDIGPEMRVTIDGRTHAIIAGPAELGRRAGLEMVCERISTLGDTP